MDQNQQEQPVGGGNVTPAQAHGKNVQYQPNRMVAPSHPPTQTAGAASASSSHPREQQHTRHYIHHLQQQELQQQLDNFWANQYQEIEDTTDFRNHSLPLARIKKIMKADEDVKMISAEAPVLFAKACEMFILELTMRAWVNAEENKKRTLQKSDIASAISRTDLFDFLVDIVPRDDTMEHEVFVGMPRRDSAPIGNVPYYYYMPPQYAAGPSYGPPRVLMGRPVLPQAHYYRQQPHPFATQVLPIPKQQNHSSDSDD